MAYTLNLNQMMPQHSIFKKHRIELLYLLASLALFITYQLQFFFFKEKKLFNNTETVKYPPISSFSKGKSPLPLLGSDVLEAINYHLIIILVLIFSITLVAKYIIGLKLKFKLNSIHLALTFFSLLGIQLFNNLSIPLIDMGSFYLSDIYINGESIRDDESILREFEIIALINPVTLALLLLLCLSQIVLLVNIIKGIRAKKLTALN